MVAFSQSVGSVSCSSRLSSSATVETFLSSMRSTIPGIVVQRAGPEAEKCTFLGFSGFRLHRHRIQEPCQSPQLYLVTVEKSPETIKEKQDKVSVTELAFCVFICCFPFFAGLKLFQELEKLITGAVSGFIICPYQVFGHDEEGTQKAFLAESPEGKLQLKHG